jgi:cytochrome b561
MTETPPRGSIIHAAMPGYSLPARALHWITAAIVISMIPIGIVMANKLAGPLQDFLFDLHRSLGATLIPIVAIRIVYRYAHRAPPLPADIPSVQQFAAFANHYALYFLLLVQPFIGWIATSAYPAPIPIFGLFQLPPIWRPDRPFSESMFFVHRMIGLTIAFLVVIHIAAALYHHFVRRDDILLRMIRG